MKGIEENRKKNEAVIYEKLSHYPPIVMQYFNWLVDTGKSINTLHVYISAITHFIDYEFGNVIPIDFYNQINSADIERYLDSLNMSIESQEEKTSASNKATKWSALNSFFQYLTPARIKSNPVERVERPLVEKTKKTEFLTIKEVITMFNNAQKINKNKICNRDICIMMLGFYCGLRSSSIVQMNIHDIDWGQNKLRVYEDKDEYYDVPMSTSVREQIHRWLIDRKKIAGSTETDALFLSLQGKRIGDDAILFLLKTYSEGIDKKVTAQMMRNTCIVNLYLKTRDLSLCAKLLNQTNISAVYRYIEKLIPISSVENAVQMLDDLYGFKPGSLA